MGTETLVAHDMIPESLPASIKGPAEQQIRHILGERYLIVDQIADSAIPATERFDPIVWWGQPGIEEAFPTLQRWALGVFACSATSCECERAFGSAKKLITQEKGFLGDNIIEALECSRAWWNNGLVKRL